MFVFVAILISVALNVQSRLICDIEGCQTNIGQIAEEVEPILLVNGTGYKFLLPKNGTIKLHCKDELTLACPGVKNVINEVNSNLTTAICTGGEKFQIGSENYKYDKLHCYKTVRGSVKECCGCCHNGHIKNVGYQITAQDWITLFKVCYNNKNGSTVSTEHTVYGDSIRHASKTNYRPSFNPEGAIEGVSVAYKKAYQKARFNQILGSATLADKYINIKSFLARGHLSPDADFLFGTWQYATYFYINACPQWQIINGGNWYSVEHEIRAAADQYHINFTVISGTYGVLSLPDKNNRSRDIYLIKEQQLAVPKYIWKVMYSSQLGRGIAFVSLNNPFIKNVTTDDYLCENICNQYGWGTKQWDQFSKGFIYCCDVRELKNAIGGVPELTLTGILHRKSSIY